MYKCKSNFKVFIGGKSYRIQKGWFFELIGFTDDKAMLVQKVKWADETSMNILLDYCIFKDYFKEV